MKKVLFVMLSLYNGGAEKSLVNMLNELPDDRYEVDLLLFKKKGMFLDQVPSWINILDTPDRLKKLYAPLKESGDMIFTKLAGTAISRLHEKNPNIRQGYRWEKFYSRKVDKLQKEYDVAIAYATGEAMFYVGEKVKAAKKIVWIHNDFRSAKHPKEYDYVYFKDMELVTISDECARIVEEEFSDLNKHVHSIANITSSAVVRRRAEEFIPKELEPDKTNIVSIGRLSEQKGFDIAIDAAAILRDRNMKFKWSVIGDGSLHDGLQKKISDKHLEDCFELIGPRENPYPYIKHCDIFAQTSRFEGKSVVLDEAKILGAPILVTDYPTVHDQIQNENEGMIVGINAEAIAAGIEKLISDKELRERYSEYLLSREYGNQDEIQKYIELIDEAI